MAEASFLRLQPIGDSRFRIDAAEHAALALPLGDDADAALDVYAELALTISTDLDPADPLPVAISRAAAVDVVAWLVHEKAVIDRGASGASCERRWRIAFVEPLAANPPALVERLAAADLLQCNELCAALTAALASLCEQQRTELGVCKMLGVRPFDPSSAAWWEFVATTGERMPTLGSWALQGRGRKLRRALAWATADRLPEPVCEVACRLIKLTPQEALREIGWAHDELRGMGPDGNGATGALSALAEAQAEFRPHLHSGLGALGVPRGVAQRRPKYQGGGHGRPRQRGPPGWGARGAGALRRFVESGEEERILEALLGGVDPDHPDEKNREGWRPLVRACYGNLPFEFAVRRRISPGVGRSLGDDKVLRIVDMLIASGANVNQVDEPLNFTPLMAAFLVRAGDGSPEIVERLLRAGARGEDLPERFKDASRGKALECIAVVRRWTEPDLRARLTRAE